MAMAIWKVRILEKAEVGGLQSMCVTDSLGLQCTIGRGIYTGLVEGKKRQGYRQTILPARLSAGRSRMSSSLKIKETITCYQC